MDKILLVDDETDIELLTKQKFRKEISSGLFKILFAHNAHDALELLEKEPGIAVVVSDLNMPGMDGLTFLDKVKTHNPLIKTIVISAYGDMKTIRTAMNTGVFDFITKPIDFNDLGEVIIRSLALYSTHSSLYTYQRLLESSFPDGVDLIYSSQEKAVLWDAFLLDPSKVILMGLTISPSLLPSDIAFGIVHGVFKTALSKEVTLPLSNIQEKIHKVISSLKISALIGRYCKISHEFSYETNGEFNVRHQGAPLPSSQTFFLPLGDKIIFQSPLSPSQLSVIEIHKD